MRKFSKLFFGFAIILLTACEQKQTKRPAIATDKFEAFKIKQKFTPDSTIFYPGIADESLRPILSNKINLAASDFENLAQSGHATDSEYQDKIMVGLQRFRDVYPQLDTEDRERICHYFEELMDIVSLDSSGGHLNEFMYGFDPTQKI
ncbi:MAG: DUF4844 domain-containing protein [Chitinophagaceae bacterium]|nr:DUF4844 domain-containing protein [Chitinophagaceae bacterium]